MIFIRCPMQYDLGVDLDGIEWVQGAVNSVIRPVNIAPNRSGKSLSDLLETGEIHAIIGSNLPRVLNRHPDSCGYFPTIARASRTISGAPGSSRSCT